MKKLTFALIGLTAFASAATAASAETGITVTLVNQLPVDVEFVAYDNDFAGNYIIDNDLRGQSFDTMDVPFSDFSRFGYSIKAYVGTTVYSDSSCQGHLNPWTGAGVLPCTAILANNGRRTTLTCVPQPFRRK